MLGFSALTALEVRLGCKWLSIHSAISKAKSKISYLQTALFADDRQILSPSACFVCFGSLARAEWTRQSDLDWILLVREGTEEQHAIALRALTAKLNKTKEIGPASRGMFGRTVFVANLTASITRLSSVADLSLRLLLLLESIAVGDNNPRTKAIREVLAAYLRQAKPCPGRAENISEVLLDDIMRFGQTMAVDLKREPPEQDGQKWGLRNVKRSFSRKLIIVTGSLACLRWKQRCRELPSHRRPAAHDAIDYFEAYLSRPPLEILASEVIQAGVPDSVAGRIFGAYDQFLAVLDDPDSREHLTRLPQNLADTSSLFRKFRAVGQEFDDDLHQLLNLSHIGFRDRVGGDMNARNTDAGLRPPLGSSTVTVFMAIAGMHPEIEQVHLGAPKVNPSLRDRLGDASLGWEFVQEAINRFPDLALPPWTKCLLSRCEIPERILEEVTFHQGIAETRFAVNVEELTPAVFQHLLERARPNSLFSLCSQVKLKNGVTKHIPMLDFLCPKSQSALLSVRRIAACLHAGAGFILESDRSYHFYGSQLLSEQELIRFLANALLFAPIVDQSWIAHQLMDNCCALRIGPRKPGGAVPTLVSFVNQ
jgi:hypothetical protein